MASNANLLAHLKNRTGGALGEAAGADMFAEGDEEAVEFDPVAFGEGLLEGERGKKKEKARGGESSGFGGLNQLGGHAKA
jgi:hypothetical protein